jgi:hypothetical protein
MQWVQWIRYQKPGKFHATRIGGTTLCSRAIAGDIVYNKPMPPEGRQDICLHCQKIEAQVGPFEYLLQ